MKRTVKRLSGEEESTNVTTIKTQTSITNQKRTAQEVKTLKAKKIVIFQVTGISLELVLIYTFTGLLSIMGAVLLAVCINNYRNTGRRSTKRCVDTQSALNIPPIPLSY